MLQEIHEQPRAIEETLSKEKKKIREVAEIIYDKKYEMVYITGSGTSYHAGLVGQYTFSALTKMINSLLPASEFGTWFSPLKPKKTLVIAISQSGESSDIIEAAKTALQKNIALVALTNTPQSSLAKMADYTLVTHAGEEHAVTATKSYASQLTVLFMLVLEIAELQGQHPNQIKNLRETLAITPRFVSETISISEEEAQKTAHKFKNSKSFFLLGSGPNYATALEGALKLKEACKAFAEGFATREFLHGPIQLIDGRTPILFILTKDEIANFTSLMHIIRNFEAPLILISEKTSILSDISTCGMHIPEGFPKVFSPILYVVPLQLFTYYSSIVRNLNPDKPEKLKKVVK
jgi:glucosamine--fructose-6-phosphate aminotransferase (isomerizing)